MLFQLRTSAFECPLKVRFVFIWQKWVWLWRCIHFRTCIKDMKRFISCSADRWKYYYVYHKNIVCVSVSLNLQRCGLAGFFLELKRLFFLFICFSTFLLSPPIHVWTPSHVPCVSQSTFVFFHHLFPLTPPLHQPLSAGAFLYLFVKKEFPCIRLGSVNSSLVYIKAIKHIHNKLYSNILPTQTFDLIFLIQSDYQWLQTAAPRQK